MSMKKLSLKRILKEAAAIEKTGRAIKLPKKSPKQEPNIGMDQTVPAQTQTIPISQRAQEQENLQDKIDQQDQTPINTQAYEGLRQTMQQYKQSDGSYAIPDSFTNQLIKQFGSLEDAAMQIFGTGTGGDDRVTITPQHPQQSIQQINQQAQQVRQQTPMAPQDTMYEPTPEEEEEANSFARRKQQIFQQPKIAAKPQQQPAQQRPPVRR